MALAFGGALAANSGKWSLPLGIVANLGIKAPKRWRDTVDVPRLWTIVGKAKGAALAEKERSVTTERTRHALAGD
jgi:hypothetical protein